MTIQQLKEENEVCDSGIITLSAGIHDGSICTKKNQFAIISQVNVNIFYLCPYFLSGYRIPHLINMHESP